MITHLSITLLAEFSADELGRGDLSWVLYDPDKVDVTSTTTITSEAGYASGSQTIFPIHLTIPWDYIPGYLHVYFSADSTIRPIDFDTALVDALLLAIRQLAIQTAPNDAGFQEIIIQELGQRSNPSFSAFLVNVWGLWKTIYASNPLMVYQYSKRHGITYLLGQYWQKYDSKEKDITERESQQFTNLMKLLSVVEKDIVYFTSITTGFIQPTVGQLSAVFPIEFIGALRSPNSILYRGFPSVIDSNPLMPPS